MTCRFFVVTIAIVINRLRIEILQIVSVIRMVIVLVVTAVYIKSKSVKTSFVPEWGDPQAVRC